MANDIQNFFKPVIDVFNFIASVINTIISGINGLTDILYSVIELILSITRILPNPLYPCLLTFLGVYSTIFIYKIIRQGQEVLL